MNEDNLFFPCLSPVGRHKIHARFDGGVLSSDGGVLILREIGKRLNFAGRLASCLCDERDPTRTIHDYATMIRACTFAISCGYEDCDDHDELRHDPALKMACERLPESGHALASKPTLSRLENTPSWRQLRRMGLALIDLYKIQPNILPPLAGQPVPVVFSYRRLLAVAVITPGSAKARAI